MSLVYFCECIAQPLVMSDQIPNQPNRDIFTDMADEALLVDLGDSKVKKNARKRNSFYSLPKTLSEDDDPFGLFQSSRDGKTAGLSESIAEKTADTKIGLLVQIDPDSPKVSVSESLYNR